MFQLYYELLKFHDRKTKRSRARNKEGLVPS